MSTAQITVPLDIPNVRVLQMQITEQGEIILTVESTLPSARCRQCGQEIRKLHGHDEWVTVRHLPILGCPVYLRYRPKRYRCEVAPHDIVELGESCFSGAEVVTVAA